MNAADLLHFGEACVEAQVNPDMITIAGKETRHMSMTVRDSDLTEFHAMCQRNGFFTRPSYDQFLESDQNRIQLTILAREESYDE